MNGIFLTSIRPPYTSNKLWSLPLGVRWTVAHTRASPQTLKYGYPSLHHRLHTQLPWRFSKACVNGLYPRYHKY